jgi:hypothetical protein
VAPAPQNGAALGDQPATTGGGQRGAPSLAWGPDVPTLLWADPKTGGDGKYCLNADKSLVKWRWMPMQREERLFPTVLAAGEETELGGQIGGGAGSRGDLEVGAFMLTTTANRRVAVRPYVSSPIDKYLSNVLISSNLIFGTAQMPGLLPSPIYSLAKTYWRFTVRNLTALATTVSGVVWGRKFVDRGRELCADQRRRAELLSVVWPYWLGPQDQTAALSGPEIALPPGGQLEVRFPIPSSFDFLARFILDDSTSTTGLEPVLIAQIAEDDTTRGLVDLTQTRVQGIAWRDFLACPTVTVPGMPSGGVVRAASLGSPRGGWTHLFKRKSAIVVKFFSGDAGTITLRPAFQGWALAAQEPDGRRYSNDASAIADRARQAAAAGADPVRFFETGGR